MTKCVHNQELLKQTTGQFFLGIKLAYCLYYMQRFSSLRYIVINMFVPRKLEVKNYPKKLHHRFWILIKHCSS